jgi:hypothetical protein
VGAGQRGAGYALPDGLIRWRDRLAAATPATAAAWLAAGLVLAGYAACLLLLFLTGDHAQAGYGAGGTVAGLVCLAVGVLVARRQPGNPIGWLLLGWAFLIPASGLVTLYAVADYRVHHGTLPLGAAALLLEPAQVLIAVLAGLAVAAFPDGTLPSRRWRWAVAGFLAAAAVFVAHLVAGQARAIGRPPVRVNLAGAPLAHPAAAPGGAAVLARAGPLAGWLVVILLLAFTARQAASYTRATGNRRQQLKWLIAGAVSCVLATAVTVASGGSYTTAARIIQDAADLGAAALPVGIGIGIVKYRLYDIDRIISRTLAYTLLTGLLAGLYTGLVLLVSWAVPHSSTVAVAAATLAVAALFNPLRRRIQRLVDRRFNRARYDADTAVAAFAARLQGAVDLDTIRADLLGVVQHSLEPAHTSIWLTRS